MAEHPPQHAFIACDFRRIGFDELGGAEFGEHIDQGRIFMQLSMAFITAVRTSAGTLRAAFRLCERCTDLKLTP